MQLFEEKHPLYTHIYKLKNITLEYVFSGEYKPYFAHSVNSEHFKSN